MPKQQDFQQADADFKAVVKPLLLFHGWTEEQISNMLPRVEWFRDHANWTCRLADNVVGDTPELEKEVRLAIAGLKSSKLVLQAYLRNQGTGPVMSYGVITVDMMAHMMRHSVGCYDKTNPVEKVPFRCLTFQAAQQLAGNQAFIWKA